MDSLVPYIGPSGFIGFWIEKCFKDHRTWDSTRTSLVSFRTHVQPEEEDPAEGTVVEGRSGREGERRALQNHPVGDPDEARMEGVGEDHRACAHSL
jgi:hypothetical protein